ncbi:acyl-CoA carboxylase subunit epsilon [Saccharothrix obliqua]|uniref:acyl-CoA carboxylase subunit epsilon n=1 Tax=Saccharothrix obliqua TaxID=2861747 RepID=UPI001C5F1F01|nr:acyl-CoA carboxylase subunit epsilon [Saccharothrix obliqua]MBW4716187.1 acyl-CoA carboxylase subunit epsilon [Saccharothrix obliqua]
MSEHPYLRVVRGNPDDVELAALTAVVAGLSGPAAANGAGTRPRPSAWSDRSRLVRHPLPHGPGAWRASGLPR